MRESFDNASRSPAGRRRGIPRSALGLALALVMLALAGAEPLDAQAGTIAGTVLNAVTLRPLGGAQVMIEGTDRGTLADANGRFLMLNVPGTEVELTVVMLGYQVARARVRVGDTGVRMLLSEAVIALDELVRAKELKKGDYVMTVGFGAGLTYAGNLFIW